MTTTRDAPTQPLTTERPYDDVLLRAAVRHHPHGCWLGQIHSGMVGWPTAGGKQPVCTGGTDCEGGLSGLIAS
jgi:hypothetical protein